MNIKIHCFEKLLVLIVWSNYVSKEVVWIGFYSKWDSFHQFRTKHFKLFQEFLVLWMRCQYLFSLFCHHHQNQINQIKLLFILKVYSHWILYHYQIDYWLQVGVEFYSDLNWSETLIYFHLQSYFNLKLIDLSPESSKKHSCWSLYYLYLMHDNNYSECCIFWSGLLLELFKVFPYSLMGQ